MAEERKGAVTMRGNPMTLVGPEIKVGQKAPEFHSVDKGLQPIGLDKFKGKVKVISVVPSIDTPVCDAQTRRFNEEASKLGEVQILTVSMDSAVRAIAMVRRGRRGQDHDGQRFQRP